MSYTATNLLYGLEQGDTTRRSTRNGAASVWGSAMPSPGAFWPGGSAFGHNLLHSAATTPAHSKATAAANNISPGSRAALQAWGSPDSADGASHIPALNGPKPSRFMVQGVAQRPGPWLELPSPGVLPATPKPLLPGTVHVVAFATSDSASSSMTGEWFPVTGMLSPGV